MGRRAAAVLCAMTAGVATIGTPATATTLQVEASIEVIDSLGDGEESFERAIHSADLSTAVRFEFDSSGAELELVVVDVEADTRRVLSMPRSFAGEEGPIALDGDGSTLLVAADWQGLVAGDEDGGLLDAFLIDTDTGAVQSLSHTLADVSIQPLSLDRAGDVVLFAAYVDGQNGSLYLWDNGVLTELTLSADPFDVFGLNVPALLSADGSTLLYSSRIGFQTRWHVRDLGSGDEEVVAAFGSSPQLSDDGSTVVALSRRSQFGSELGVWDTAGTSVRVIRSGVGAFAFVIDSGATNAVVSGSGISTVNGFEEYVSQLVRIDLASGETTELARSREGFEFDLRAASDDVQQLVVWSYGSLIASRPITLDEAYGGGVYNPATYLIDFAGSTAPVTPLGYVGTLDDQMARLYEAYFDRAPDAGGLQFWREQRAGGRSLDSVSDEFARSPEFIDTYGSLDDAAFVDLVYQNVLNRAPDAGGRAFWLDQLANGRTRGSLMTLFSESPEFIDATGTRPAPTATEAAITRLYAALFGREPDEAGLASWAAEVDRGVPFDDVVWYFIQTDEFQQRYGGAEFDPFVMVTIVYANTIDAQVDDAGFVLADTLYTEGRPVEEIVAELLNSPRFVAATSSTPPAG